MPVAPTTSERTPADLFKELAPSVVTVTVKKNGSEGGGTGFLVDKDGTIATNHHVIDAVSAVRVKFKNGTIYDDVELLIRRTLRSRHLAGPPSSPKR